MERRSELGNAIQCNCAAMQSHQPASDAEPQSNPLPTIFQSFGLHKRFKNLFLKFRRNSHTGIRHPKMDMWKLNFGSKDDGSLLGELEGVAKQVHEYLTQPDGIGMENRKVSRRLKGQINFFLFVN